MLLARGNFEDIKSKKAAMLIELTFWIDIT